ncbi:eukaryotic translation initiation factor 3 subunit K-like [Sycon ciliatum]|uniref:eukaryotic translation initiation factor 3 subunit K-like n=1 Tax=Sycon ciliatum TaxID=27933 RepID=UPI0031F720C0
MASEQEQLLDIRGQIAGVLDGIDRYNPTNLPVWEKYVELQASTGEYDFEANLAVLKLYQFNPASFRADVAATILLKALMNLPSIDFSMCKAILPEAFLREDSVSTAIYLADLLETCYFTRFWTEVVTFNELTQSLKGFENAVRQYVCQVITITFQSIPSSQLVEQLGNVSDEQLEALIEANSWKKQADGTIFVGKKEAPASKPKKLVEQLDLDTVLPVLNQQRRR